ncbi:MAG TPA: thioredoxin family protein [Phycisphaeraceae bacterium]
MAVTPSTMLALGTPAPDFALPDTEGNLVSRQDFQGKPLLVMFICNHCPYVRHVAPELARLARDYIPKGVGIVAINSNDTQQYPNDNPQRMKEEKAARGYPFPYLFDETQEVAKAYTAACTPDFFLFDRDHILVYRGQLDDSRPTRIASGVYDSTQNRPTGKDLRDALDAVLAGRSPNPKQKPSMGCNIKWKPDNAPDYA